MNMIAGAEDYDRLFLGIEIGDVHDGILYVFVKNPQIAAELEAKYAPQFAVVSSPILQRDIQIVNVLPKIAKTGTSPSSDAATRD
ncbi:MAG TPA: hypothetical protein VGC26_04765 [Afipia sp.]